MGNVSFYVLAETWYQRTHKLREVFYNENESKERRLKAGKLFFIMFQRMHNVLNESTKRSQPKMPIRYKNGGI